MIDTAPKFVELGAKRVNRRQRPQANTIRKLKCVDLFCGAGGLSAGFREAGFDILCGVDHDPDAIATFAGNFTEAECFCGDIRSPSTRSKIGEYASKADVIIGGPPCQAFSQMRNHSRLIDDPRNSLYREFVGIVSEAQPQAFVMENVTGLDQMGVRKQIASDLTIAGMYSVLPQILDAADYGVPQTRKRLIFIGIHRDLRVDPPSLSGSSATSTLCLSRKVGKPTRYEIDFTSALWANSLLKSLDDPSDLSLISVKKAISDLRNLPLGNRDDVVPYSCLPRSESAYQDTMRKGAGDFIRNVQVPRINDDTSLRLKSIPEGGNHRDLPESLLGRYLTGKRWGQDNGSGLLSRRHFYAYRKLHPAIWAWTLNTKADSAYHYAVPRALSVREFARLQSFPDRFVFTTDPRKGLIPGRIDGGGAHSRYRQVGNAVPPLLAQKVGEAVKKALTAALSDTLAAA